MSSSLPTYSSLSMRHYTVLNNGVDRWTCCWTATNKCQLRELSKQHIVTGYAAFSVRKSTRAGVADESIQIFTETKRRTSLIAGRSVEIPAPLCHNWRTTLSILQKACETVRGNRWDGLVGVVYLRVYGARKDVSHNNQHRHQQQFWISHLSLLRVVTSSKWWSFARPDRDPHVTRNICQHFSSYTTSGIIL